MQRTLAILRAILTLFERPLGRCRTAVSLFLLDTFPTLRGRAVSRASLLKKIYSPLALGLILGETDANRGQHDQETIRWRLAL